MAEKPSRYCAASESPLDYRRKQPEGGRFVLLSGRNQVTLPPSQSAPYLVVDKTRWEDLPILLSLNLIRLERYCGFLNAFWRGVGP